MEPKLKSSKVVFSVFKPQTQKIFLSKKTKRRKVNPAKKKELVRSCQEGVALPPNELNIQEEYSNDENNLKMMGESLKIKLNEPSKENIKYETLKKVEIERKYCFEAFLDSKNNELQSLIKNYLEFQPEMSEDRRVILVNWVMAQCTVFNLRRETFHLSVLIIDTYLSRSKNIALNQIQLLGLTALLISAKNEEVLRPCIENFIYRVKNIYTAEEINKFEIEILRHLNWKIQYLTLLFWGDYMIYKWDKFTKSDKSAPKFYHENDSTPSHLVIYFYAILDTITLDYYHIFSDFKVIALSILYLLIGIKMKYFSLKDIKDNITKTDGYSQYQEYNLYFVNFLNKEVEIDLAHLDKNIEYVSNFFEEDVFSQYSHWENSSPIYLQDYSNVKLDTVKLVENKRNQVV